MGRLKVGDSVLILEPGWFAGETGEVVPCPHSIKGDFPIHRVRLDRYPRQKIDFPFDLLKVVQSRHKPR